MGKDLLTHSFYTTLRHIHRHYNMESDVITPIDVVDVFNANGEENNTVAELVRIDQTCVESFEEKNNSVVKKLKFIAHHMEAVLDVESQVVNVHENSKFPATKTNQLDLSHNEANEANEACKSDIADPVAGKNDSSSEEEEEVNLLNCKNCDDTKTEKVARENLTECVVYGVNRQ